MSALAKLNADRAANFIFRPSTPPTGRTRTGEFTANPSDWVVHGHRLHHVMNQMGHTFGNVRWLDGIEFAQKIAEKPKDGANQSALTRIDNSPCLAPQDPYHRGPTNESRACCLGLNKFINRITKK